MNGDELVDAVGAILNIGDPGASTTPTSDTIVDWLNMAQSLIARNAPEADLQTLMAIVIGTYSAGVTLTDGVRCVSATINSEPATYVPPHAFEHWDVGQDKSGWSYGYNTTDDDPNIYFKPSVSAAYSIAYIKRPAALTDASSRAVHTVDVIYDQVLVLYAVAMAKIQDEEMPDAQYLLQLVGATLGRSGLPDSALAQGR